MYSNRYDHAIDIVGREAGVNWNEHSKVHLFARFLEDCEDHVVTFAAWEEFLQAEADFENGGGVDDDEEMGEEEGNDPDCDHDCAEPDGLGMMVCPDCGAVFEDEGWGDDGPE
jgi:hypothetical protein